LCFRFPSAGALGHILTPRWGLKAGAKVKAMNKPARVADVTTVAGILREPANGYPDILLHPAWRYFLSYCAGLRYGEIHHLSIQDGLPVLAQVTTKKVKFT